MTNTLLITGTDTGVGKTVLTTALVAYWQTYHSRSLVRRLGRSLGVMKPIQAGLGDRELYMNLSLDQTSEQITPLFFQAPIAPPLAAAREGQQVNLATVWKALENLRSLREFVLVEAVGGLGTPITDELTVADLAAQWHLPAVLVVPVRLGAIAQAVANVALARLTRVQLKGIVLNCVQPCSESEIADWAPVYLIQSLTNVPILGCLPYMTHLTESKLAQVASDLDLERLTSPI